MQLLGEQRGSTNGSGSSRFGNSRLTFSLRFHSTSLDAVGTIVDGFSDLSDGEKSGLIKDRMNAWLSQKHLKNQCPAYSTTLLKIANRRIGQGEQKRPGTKNSLDL
jgi:hypothetical protein